MKICDWTYGTTALWAEVKFVGHRSETIYLEDEAKGLAGCESFRR